LILTSKDRHYKRIWLGRWGGLLWTPHPRSMPQSNCKISLVPILLPTCSNIAYFALLMVHFSVTIPCALALMQIHTFLVPLHLHIHIFIPVASFLHLCTFLHSCTSSAPFDLLYTLHSNALVNFACTCIFGIFCTYLRTLL
jgi:hypothetical protein